MTEIKTTSENVLAVSQKYSAATEALKELFPGVFDGELDLDLFDMEEISGTDDKVIGVYYDGLLILTISEHGIKRNVLSDYHKNHIPIDCANLAFGSGYKVWLME